MITQDWTVEESKAIEEIGFSLNKRGHYTFGGDSLKDLTLAKRLDAEFNEMFYQAYNPTGLIINIAINHIENSFDNFLTSVRSELEDKFDFEKLQEYLLKKHNCKIELVEENEVILLKINGSDIRKFQKWEGEIDILYCLLYNLKLANIL